ncbi:DUF523 domain-containing protein [Effusibacillus pohliae]|uniref:DUF523 domain-containing protein n=1 Tax=Effusibacillus pohliae TaxID=232270 RepID=UPI000381078E|nr:DUF523 domain-containing protein [Effusibacillus pohliae]
MILISACLIGCHCRYDGDSNLVEELKQMVERGEAIPVCPEQMGGLPTPRPPAQIVGGVGKDVLEGQARVMTDGGVDVTDAFLKGAEETLRIARLIGATRAVLKERSPSCGSSVIYDGSFTGGKKPGRGVTAALLEANGIRVSSEETYKK